MRQTLRDLCEGWTTSREVYEVSDHDDLTIYDTKTRQPICAVEIWEGQLRVLVWDNNDPDDDPRIIPIKV